ncbi:type II toxin-antitoxin system MqsR family toxin [Pseudomonas sp. NPDC096950]|uniref:type II toxin-antitoxin system MqsR family toxin n=1 Tax=Pseudomonas sp. NPDC096950 TaxID=3364485 RepID=UPI003839D21E
MEKNTPHYDLTVVKSEVLRLRASAFTSAAKTSGRYLGLSVTEMREVIFKLQGNMLYKSMTTYANHRVWQDVYHINSHDLEIYIKVTYRPGGGPPVISFKEKNL